MEKTKRMFIAVNIPQGVKTEISRLLELVPKEKWRKTRQENMHMTLAFLGYLDGQKEKEAIEAMNEHSELEEFEIELNSFGQFGNRIIWIGPGKGKEELNHLAGNLNKALHTGDDRFHPHITIARNKGAGAMEVNALLEKLRGTDFSKKISVESIELMHSSLHRQGPDYRIVHSVRFQGKGPL